MMFKFHVMTLLCQLHVLQVASHEASQPKAKEDESYGVLISGGVDTWVTAELYLPSSGVSCSLPHLSGYRACHTMESSGLLCGGYPASPARHTCLQFSPDSGSWEELEELDAGRTEHVSWTPGSENGTYLMGGRFKRGNNRRTTVLINPDGTQEPGFDLKYNTDGACAIPTEDTVILTGGGWTMNTVSVYTVEGWQEDLPPLNTGRRDHACSSYWSGERRVFIVTGGYSDKKGYHHEYCEDTTETLASNQDSWTTSGSTLPQGMSGLRAANIDGRVLIFGGHCFLTSEVEYDDILEYIPEDDSIQLIGNMLQTRGFHAVSVVQAQDYVQWCQQSFLQFLN